MQKLTPIQSSFAAGEISPRLRCRYTSEAYKNGVGEMTNFMAVPQGPAQRRWGTQFIGMIEASYGRVFTFHVNSEQSYVVVVANDGYIYLADRTSFLFDAGDEHVSNGDFLDGDTDWTDISTGKGRIAFNIGSVSLFPHNLETDDAGVKQTITIADTGVDHTLTIQSQYTSYMAPLRIKLGTTVSGTEILDVTIHQSAYSFDFTPAVGTIYLEIIAEGGDRTLSRVIDKVTIHNEGADYLAVAHPWEDTDIEELQVAMPPDTDDMYFVCGDKAPQKLSFTVATRAWALAAVSFTATPADWVATNYPSTICFFQGRSWWGGTPATPSKFWASKSGDYEDMTTGSLANDALAFTITKRGRIRWMAGIKNLVIGTEYGEHIITAEAGLITPSDISADQQSAYGSRKMQAEEIGNKAVYVSGDGKKIRDIGYKWTDEGWVSRDIAFISEHIAKTERVKELMFAQNPENQLWMISETGKILGCTYEHTNDIIGWSRHETDGFVYSGTVLQTRGVSEPFFLIDREIQATPYLYLERACFEGCLDCYALLEFETATDTLTGLDHLIGKTCDVLVDGAVHPQVDVDESGEATLQYEGYDIKIGLNFVSTLTTLPVDYGTEEGASTPKFKRFNQVYVRILDSYMPLINGERPPVRNPSTPMDTPEAAKSEDVRVSPLGWSQEYTITVSQDLPLRCMITGLFGELGEDMIK